MKKMKIKCLTIKYLLIAIVTFNLSACSEAPDVPLRIASSPWPGYEPLYLARELGYLDKEKFKLFDLPSSGITMESIRNGSADVGTLTMDETIELLDDGVPIVVVAVLDISNGADAVVARPEIKTLADIKGKRIAMTDITLGLYMLSRLLEKAGVDREVEYYKKGKADILITFEPMKSHALKQGGHVIFDSSDIPNEIVDLLIVNKNIYKERRNDVCELLNQWYRTLDYIHNNPEKAALKITQRMKVSESDYHKIMEGLSIVSRKENINLLGGVNPEIIPSAEKVIGVMLKNKQIAEKINFSAAIRNDIFECI